MTTFRTRPYTLDITYEELSEVIAANHLALQIAQDLNIGIARRLNVIKDQHTATELLTIQPHLDALIETLAEQREAFQELLQ